MFFKIYIKHERPCLTTLPNAEKRVENTTYSEVFLTNVLIETILRRQQGNKIVKTYANEDGLMRLQTDDDGDDDNDE